MGYNKITLYGNQICDYVYIQKNPVSEQDFNTVDSEPKEWNSNTLMLSNFDNESLSAGKSSLLAKINKYEIRRREGVNPYTKYIGTVSNNTEDDLSNKFLVDYLAKNNSSYTYYLYPTSNSDGKTITLPPSITPEIHTDWEYWTLMIVDETDEENVFFLNKMFKFELNLTEGDMSNNTVSTITQNFTKYPTIQRGISNYWSGDLTALCGFISCNDYEYTQTPNMIEELKRLGSDTRRKFLKDIFGNVWEVEISAPIIIGTDANVLQRPKTVKLSWVEVGDASDISVINNPKLTNNSWILTEAGEVVSYVDYIWGDQYIWNDSYIWTEKNDTLKTEASNMGRKIQSEGGDA